MSETRGRYRVVLRAIGAYLDEHLATMVNVIELQEGFSVRYQRAPEDPGLSSAEFRRDDLVSLKRHLEWRRHAKWPTANSSGEEVEQGSDRYQDLFRALGYELDEMHAYGILLDETDDGLLLTYLRLEPAHGLAWRKRKLEVGEAQQREMVGEAHKRRAGNGHRDTRLGRLTSAQQSNGRKGIQRPPVTGAKVRAPVAPWEVGEREVYRSEVKSAWTGPKRSHGGAELVLSNRRIILRFPDGATDRTLLRSVVKVDTDVRRDLLTKHYRIEIEGSNGDHIRLDCFDPRHMTEMVTQIENARSMSGG